MESFDGLIGVILVLALATTRFTVAFAAIPLFSTDIIPATVRNSIFIALGMIVLVMVPPVSPVGLTTVQWILLFAKEVFVGFVIGLLFGSVLWAMEMAGAYIDNKMGATSAQIVDPMSGNQVSLSGAFLARLANYIFLMSGGFLAIIGTVLQSYILWPVDQVMPDLKAAGLTIFTAEIRRMMILALLIAAPALVLLSTIDWGMGLLNRFVQQLNVFVLSMPIKAWIGQFVIVSMLAIFVKLVASDLLSRSEIILRVLKNL
jgi:type III secretion protein T